MMTLYYSPGACSAAPHIVLIELGIEHDLVLIDTRTERNRLPAFLAKNPLGRVPVLRLDDGQHITEVAAILQYLAACAPTHNLVPIAQLARARCDEWVSLLGTTMHPAFAMVLAPARFVADEDAQAALRQAGRERFGDLLRHANERLLGTDAWVLGADYSICDPYLWVMCMWASYIGIDISLWSKLASWAVRMQTRPAVRTMLRNEGLVDDGGQLRPPPRSQ